MVRTRVTKIPLFFSCRHIGRRRWRRRSNVCSSITKLKKPATHTYSIELLTFIVLTTCILNPMTESSSALHPPSPSNRLFLDGLSNSVTNNALISLLKPFGEVVRLDRNPSGFAHLTLQAESHNIDKCLRTLNRTKWRGETLRVERAREHFLHRLQQEWGETEGSISNETTALSPLTESQNDDSKPTGAVSIRFSWKGRHVQFSESDSVSSEESGAINDSEIDTKAMHDVRESSPKMSQESHPRPQKRPSAVTSTLQLFGLPTIVGHPSGATTTNDAPLPTGTAEKDNGNSGAKRGRASDLTSGTTQYNQKKKMRVKQDTIIVGMDIAKACAVEENVALIDLSSERVAALAIISNMFDSGDEGTRCDTEREFKSGVYEIQDSSVAEMQQDEGRHSRTRRLALFRKLAPAPPLEHGHQVEAVLAAISATHDPEPNPHCRRKGLFRKLASVQQYFKGTGELKVDDR